MSGSRIFRGDYRRKAGLPPGTPVYVGPRRTEPVFVSVLDYTSKGYTEHTDLDVASCVPFKESPSITWVDVRGIHDTDEIARLAAEFGLHDLTVEDIVNSQQRPKSEDFGDYLFVVLKLLTPSAEGASPGGAQVSLVLGDGYVLTFQEHTGEDVFEEVRQRIRNGRSRIRGLGSDYLTCCLIDAVVDGYYLVLDQLAGRFESMEEEVMLSPTAESAARINALKHDLLFLRKSVWPLREEIRSLNRTDSPLILPATQVYYRDVWDHLVHVIETAEIYREIVSGLRDTYLSSLSNRLNEVMKVLTVISTIFIPLTFISGVYGMNFEHIPELHWRYGYFLTLAVMALVAGAMLVYFRVRRWL